MGIRFKDIAAVYTVLWILVILSVCACEWHSLEQFQSEYEAKGVTQEVQNSEEIVVPEKITLSVNEVEEIIADSSMKIYVDGKRVTPVIKSEIKNQIYDDYSELTGNTLKQYVYEVNAESLKDISVLDRYGNEMDAGGNDFTKSSYSENSELAETAVDLFEYYLKHISQMISLSELQCVMRTQSKAYKAVEASQQSLKWMVAAKEMVFVKETAENMMLPDENHMICDIHIDLAKTTENNRTVNETVHYRVLYEKIDGNWYIYSFVTLLE